MEPGGKARLLPGRLRVHDMHRQLRPAGESRDRGRRSPPKSSGTSASSRCCPAIGTSKSRIHPQVRASYLASPPLVVAYALAGRVDVDLTTEPLGHGAGRTRSTSVTSGRAPEEIVEAVGAAITSEQFSDEYGRIFEGDDRWRALDIPSGPSYAWDAGRRPTSRSRRSSTSSPPGADPAISRARGCLVKVGDSITTDHISPAGAIKRDSPAGRYLTEHGVEPRDFNSYGSRRGNHHVMMRGTFANIRLRNELAPGTEGSWTTHLPDGEVTSVFDAAERYRGARASRSR